MILSDRDELNALRRPLSEYDEELAAFAEDMLRDLFGRESFSKFSEQGIDPFDLIYVKNRSINERSTKYIKKYGGEERLRLRGLLSCAFVTALLRYPNVYVCRLTEKDKYYELGEPEKIVLEAEEGAGKWLQRIVKKSEKKAKPFPKAKRKNDEKIERIKLLITHSCLESAVRDYNFVMRFNREMFYQYITDKGRRLSTGHVEALYNSRAFNLVVDMKNQRTRDAIIALYGIAFEGLTLSELYSVGSIFSPQENRETDNRKKAAGTGFFMLLQGNDSVKIGEAFKTMGRAMTMLTLPKFSASDLRGLNESFTLFAELSAIGAAYYSARHRITIVSGAKKEINAYFETARRLAAYSAAVEFCRDICENKADDPENMVKLQSYKTARRLEKLVSGKNIAGELDFGEGELNG